MSAVESKHQAELLRRWYIIDTNAIPNVYTLQNINTVFKHYLNKSEKELMARDQGDWYRLVRFFSCKKNKINR